MNKSKIIIGLTGQIASGKSTVGKIFASLGAQVIDTDILIHQLQKPNTPETKAIANVFTDEILNPDASINRSIFAKNLMAEPAKLQIVENILFSALKTLIIKEIAQSSAKIIIIEAPLLFEAELAELCDEIIFCHSPANTRKQRALTRPNMTLEKYNFLNNHQLTTAKFKQKCTITIKTNGTKTELKQKVTEIYANIILKAS